MISHILFPSDLTAPTQAAFELVIELAAKFKAKVTLFHAYELLSTSTAGMYDLSYSSALQELELSMEEKARAHLGEFKHRLEQAGIKADLRIARGHAGELIVEQAKASACDLIVMGSRGLGPVKSMLMGSTSTYVLHHSSCPMLILPVPAE